MIRGVMARRIAASFLRAASTSAVPATLEVSLGDLQLRQTALEIQTRLAESGNDVVSKRAYYQQAGNAGLTRAEAGELLDTLVESGGVYVQGEVVYLTPTTVFNRVNKELGLPDADPCPEVTAALEVAKAEFAKLDAAKSRADLEVSQKRLRFWAVVSAASALQMTTFAYLTFPSLSGKYCLGWDVIEPICFFVMQAYIVGWFSYFFYTKREHSLTAWDQRHLLKMSDSAYSRRKVDISKWLEYKKEVERLEAEQKKYAPRQ